ncbi:uncharacterized protein ACN2A1_011533 isoform 3-T22 [Glossina fuscipes fuscipes]
MRNLVVYLLIFGLYAMQTVVGHMNSDPAPGRSPGPPMIVTTKAELTNTAEDTHLAAAHYDDIKINITATIKTTKQPTHYHHQQKQYRNINDYNTNLPNASSLGKDLPSVEGTIQQADDDAINFRLAKSENNYMPVNDNVDIANVEVIDDDNNDSDENEDATVSFAEDAEMTSNIDYNATRDKLNNYAAEAEQNEENVFSTSTSTSRTVHSSSMQSSAVQSACASQLSDFLDDVPVIDAVDMADQANSTSIPQGLQIQLELLHDTFDTTTTNFGINCGLMYKVRLTTTMPTLTKTTKTTNSATTTSTPLSTSSTLSFSTQSTLSLFSPLSPPSSSSLSSSSSSSSPSSFANKTQSATPDAQQIVAHYTGDFHIETVSLLTSKERGSFVSDSLDNKLPISWFASATERSGNWQTKNTYQQQINQQLFNNEYAAASTFTSNESSGEWDDIDNQTSIDYNTDDNHQLHYIREDNLTLRRKRHDAYDAYSTTNNKWRSLQHKRQVDGATALHERYKLSEGENAKICPDNKWRGSTKSIINAHGNPATESLSLWLVNELCEQEDIIEFRVFFRLRMSKGNKGENANNISHDNRKHYSVHSEGSNYNEATLNRTPTQNYSVLMYRKTFQFKLRKDCQILLKETSVGNLDYTTLPLYCVDCTVHFPLFGNLDQRNSPNESQIEEEKTERNQPPGILVELQRLNVPCGSGGYVRFSERRPLCGKLEELNDNDRVYHFDVRHRTSVQFYRNPMFSLSFKLVDYCYNVTTSNETGEFYIRPSVRDVMECYFRIHLPYGNRVLLRMVTNNDSTIMPSFSTTREAFNEADMYTIFTSYGANIDTQLLNLTLSGPSSYNGLNLPALLRLPSMNYSKSLKEEANKAFISLGLDAFGFLAASKANMQMALTNTANCAGVIIKVFENDHSKWSHCVNNTKYMRGFILESSSNILSVHLFRPASKSLNSVTSNSQNTSHPAIYLSYRARPKPDIVSSCAFGWIAMQQFCIAAIEAIMTWHEAEQRCVQLGGHLVSIRNEQQQQTINELLLNSPGYEEQSAYWVGGSDKSYEGDFRWSDGLMFQYTNWFPGWSQHGHYNKQPNDDGLSSQDCIELRRYFRTPPGVQTSRGPLTSKYMWNDRDCNAKNALICERAMGDESYRRSWLNDCNKTVSLSKEHPRASIWSPSFPRQYPDNANCFTTITAPQGYRIVIEFEELVIENEPGCTYDYLEITEPKFSDSLRYTKSSSRQRITSPKLLNVIDPKHSNTNSKNNINYVYKYKNNNNVSDNLKILRKRNSYDSSVPAHQLNSAASIPSSSLTSSAAVFHSEYVPLNTDYNNYDMAQNNYKKLLQVYSSLYGPQSNFIVKTPDYPHGNPYYHRAATAHTVNDDNNKNKNYENNNILPKRLCGDWSTKLKLLRYVSLSSYLGLHFVSDYSHHFGGYKAKTYMENRSYLLRAASECANERLKPYNGSCYLFVSYPEVDWWTAQQVCRGMGAKLTSVSSADEHRFITSNIRNQIDYSPQLIYWLGAELEKSGQFEWTDDTKMNFQGWLPGQGQFNVLPSDAICLGLQWKMSPTPMLPSGLYWQAQKCNKVGGYVCKKPKESFGNFAFNNFTITGTEGRLMSPAYPNNYPLNIDYWIHIKAPLRTRIVVQFQKIDLEPQDECLYDYISIQDYDIVSKLMLEPGTNTMPLAMLMSDEQYIMDETKNNNRNRNIKSNANGNNNNNNESNENISIERDNDSNIADKSSYTNKNIKLRRRLRRRTKRETSTRKATVNTAMPQGHQLLTKMERKCNIQYVTTTLRSMKIPCANIIHGDDHERQDQSIKVKNIKSRKIIKRNDNRKKHQFSQKRKLISNGEYGRQPWYNKSLYKKNYFTYFTYNHNDFTEYPNRKKRKKNRKGFQLIGGDMEVKRKRRSTIVGDESTPNVDNAQSFLPYVRWCGAHDSNMSKFDFVSNSNEVVLNFHSDYSITGLGFAAVWKAIDISGCPLRTLTSREGTIYSPNFPHFLLNNLNCVYVIQAPGGRRVWLEFTEFDFQSDSLLEVDIGNGFFSPFRLVQHLNDGMFVSLKEQLRIQFRTGQHPRGKGFRAVYHTVGQTERRERVINLTNNDTGYLYQLNYPHDMPENVDFTQHILAPFGHNILLEMHGVEFTENGCQDNNLLEIYDNYADNNGTKWQLCKYKNANAPNRSPIDENYHVASVQYAHRRPLRYRTNSKSLKITDIDDNGREIISSEPDDSSNMESSSVTVAEYLLRQQFRPIPPQPPPVYITSYLNTLYVRQRTTAKSHANLNCTIRLQWDNNYKMKLASGDKTVESCQPNPCQYNGKCLINNGTSYCQCQGHYTGRFCGLNLCELEPCVFGKCELTTNNFKCKCQPGYMGITCEQKQRPCADNPCEGRGICHEKNSGFFCRCYAWWEGQRCEKRMLHIPYKPLSERMLQEPFWLGLITVFVVLAVIGLVWCAKRHFPEKIEKLLAEEADRNRPPGSIRGHHHHTSLREQLQFTTAIPQSTVNNVPGAPRSIFNRLGIRKPSILSLSSPNPIQGGGGAAARTFSLDDLLRPPPRRSPSPRKKRNNSTPVKKNAAEKKQILQQLVSPSAAQAKPKVSLGELISLSESRIRASNVDSESDMKETTFSENTGSLTSVTMERVILNDPKLEKKVTFARLLSKVSAEMSSGSEAKRNSSAISLPTDLQMQTSSMPPSPCTNDIRSPHSTSSNHGSDSLSSSDLALTDFGLRSIQTSASEITSTSNHQLSLGGMPLRGRIAAGSPARAKVSSADSILAMFRNLATTVPTISKTTATATVPLSATVFVSPSTTPTVSSPQDDAPGDDESSTSSMHTPVSLSSGPPDSPVFYRQTTTIEVPVLDVLNAHKSSSSSSSVASTSSTNMLHPPTILLEIPISGINNKCLSPIREMPTPIPSPALTPIMMRPQRSNSPIFQQEPSSGAEFTDDDNDDDDGDDDEDEEKSDRSDTQLSDKLVAGHSKEKMRLVDSDVETTPTDTCTTSIADFNKQTNFDVGSKLSPLNITAAIVAPMEALVSTLPSITIDIEPPTPEEKQSRPRDLVIPTLTVEQASPTKTHHPMVILPGSPPPQRASIGETSFMFPNKQQQKRLLKQYEKPTSLEYSFTPPMITVTSNMSELESDIEPLSPATKVTTGNGLVPPNPVGMCYLSPFAMCTRADRTISESNLSSSGYSSMASPGPSRCGSNNPLYPNEMDEPGSGHASANLSLHVNLLNRRRNSALPSCKENISNGKSAAETAEGGSAEHLNTHRPRSDSETFSDDILVESNDEGIGTDPVDEKLDETRLSRHRFDTLLDDDVLIEVDEPTISVTGPSLTSNANTITQMAQLQLPSIVIQIDGNGGEKSLSPVSSRSESPLSERASMGRFSPYFYGRKDQLPFTDSDGLYDFPSSDGKGTSGQMFSHQRRSSSKKRERKSSKCSATQSPTKQVDMPSKESLNISSTPSSSVHVCNKHCHSHHHPCSAITVTSRKSPKRRLQNRYAVASSSSSSESLNSTKDLSVRQLPRRLNSPNREKRTRRQESLSEDDVADALLRRISPSIVKEDDPIRPTCKINRLRAIGNQIRFLRRLEKSIKTRERIASPTDSCPEENTDDLDSPRASSPLLQPLSPNKTRLTLCRQKRLPSGTYGITAAALNSTTWKGTDRSLIADDLNSD